MNNNTYLLKTHDGLELYTKLWEPETTPRAVVCMVHGLGEHINRYEHVAALFNNLSIAFIGIDYRGHGQSQGKKGHTPSYEHLLQDVDLLIDKATELFPEIPVIIYGHSLGGNIVLNYVLNRKPKDLKGVIVTSPWLRLPIPPPAIKALLGKWMRNIYPALTQASGLDASGISRIKEEVDKYVNDPLVHDKISVELFKSGEEHGEWAIEHAAEWNWPLLLAHGSADLLTSHKGSEEFAAKTNGQVNFKLFEGAYHEIHNDIDKEELFDLIKSWINELLGSDIGNYN